MVKLRSIYSWILAHGKVLKYYNQLNYPLHYVWLKKA